MSLSQPIWKGDKKANLLYQIYHGIRFRVQARIRRRMFRNLFIKSAPNGLPYQLIKIH